MAGENGAATIRIIGLEWWGVIVEICTPRGVVPGIGMQPAAVGACPPPFVGR